MGKTGFVVIYDEDIEHEEKKYRVMCIKTVIDVLTDETVTVEFGTAAKSTLQGTIADLIAKTRR